MKKLIISKDISFPPDVVTQTLAAIGRKGSGKTYLATMIMEQMLDIGAQVVAIDPIGNWWGLRVGADGRSKGKDIFVMGGDHGDVPLVPEAGARIAKLIVDKQISAVLDVSSFRLNERKRFCTDFGEEILHLKKSRRTPVHIFIEEAQLLIPQRVGPDEARMVGAFEQIVRLGRNYGIGCTLVTQRPQSVNKEVLSQVECLCVLQITGPHERKALEEWVQEVGADRKLIGELPGLGRGEGYVWSPGWLRIYKRVKFSKKTTFDASATPKVGQAARTAKLSKVDINRLRKDMEDVLAQAEKDDPKALRRRIVELEKEGKNSKGVKSPQNPNPVKIQKITVPAVGKRTLERLKKVESSMRKMLTAAKNVNVQNAEHLAVIDKNLNRFSEEIARVESNQAAFANAILPKPKISGRTVDLVKYEMRKNNIDPLPLQPPLTIGVGERTILSAVAQYTPGGITNEHIAVLTGYKATSRRTYLQLLTQKGLIERSGDLFLATERGKTELGPGFKPLPTGPELQEYLLHTLPSGEAKILKVLLDGPKSGVSREAIMEATGYKQTSVRTYLQFLSARKVIENDRSGLIKVSENLFKD